MPPGTLLPASSPHAVDERYIGERQAGADTAGVEHFMKMAEEPEPGYVRGALYAGLHHGPQTPPCSASSCSGQPRQSRHPAPLPALIAVEIMPNAERFGQHESITRPRACLQNDPVGTHNAGDRHPVLRLPVIDGVSADDASPLLRLRLVVPRRA